MALTKQPSIIERMWGRSSPAKTVAETIALRPGDGSASGSAIPSQRFQAETVVKTSVETSASSPANGSVQHLATFPPLTIVRCRETVRVKREPDEKVEWKSRDFAELFLRWLVAEYPDCRGAWVRNPDIAEEFFPRFRVAADCLDLQLGALLRGLGEVTDKRERAYTDRTGRRCSVTEYRVPVPGR